MPHEITFIHAADLHLGAPVRGLSNLDAEWSARLRRSIPEAYERVIEAAISHNVDFVIIAGDIFDSSRPSFAEFRQFFDGLDRLDSAGIPTFIVAGNHDPYTHWAQDLYRLPQNTHFLGARRPEFALYTNKEGEALAMIAGRSYFNQTWPDDERISNGITRQAMREALGTDAPFAIGIIHTGLDLDPNKAPSDPLDLLSTERGIDYWACGHLHKRHLRDRIVFPGCIQARDMKETGERGCLLVTLREEQGEAAREVTCEFESIPTASVVLQSIQVDVSTCRTLADLEGLVAAALFHENGSAHCDYMVVHVTLTGTTELHSFLRQPDVISGVRKHINNKYPTFYCDSIKDMTRIPAESDRSSNQFHQVLAQMSQEQGTHSEKLINYIQSEFVKWGIAIPSSLAKRIDDFNDAAEILALDLLDEGRS